jgi:hypothetical protein
MGAYLAAHETAVAQYRSPRRARPTGLVCVHTAESVLDTVGPDAGAENVAEWMTRRTNYGSYHDLADSDSVVHLVAYGDEAFHDGTGSNPWSLSISFALAAADWPKLTPEKRRGFLRQGAVAFARQQAWLKAHGHPTTPLRRVTRAQSDAGQPGFISHAERDPSRRTDPGAGFPWEEFFTECRAALAGTNTSEEDDMTPDQVRVLTETKNAVDLLVKVAERPLQVEARLTARIAALQSLVQQLAQRQGTPIDLDAVEAVVEKGVADALAAIETTVRVDTGRAAGSAA